MMFPVQMIFPVELSEKNNVFLAVILAFKLYINIYSANMPVANKLLLTSSL